MLYLLIKAALSGVVIAIASEVARRWPGWGALIVSLPLVSVLAMLWLWPTRMIAAAGRACGSDLLVRAAKLADVPADPADAAAGNVFLGIARRGVRVDHAALPGDGHRRAEIRSQAVTRRVPFFADRRLLLWIGVVLLLVLLLQGAAASRTTSRRPIAPR